MLKATRFSFLHRLACTSAALLAFVLTVPHADAENCPAPYHGIAQDGRCVWTCGVGTTPDSESNECVCRAGFVPAGLDQFGRITCEPPDTSSRGGDKRIECEAYAASAVEQQEANLRRNCGFSGHRWDHNYEHHFDWCMTQSAATRDYERSARERELLKCRAANPITPRPSPTPRPGCTAGASACACFNLWVARNQIYKDNGYCFKTKKARDYFGNDGCWTSNPKLSPSDWAKVKRIRRQERYKGCR